VGAEDCEQLVLRRDRVAGATVLIAIHDTRRGPAHGGIRRWPYADVAAAWRDVVALARAMTWKCALAGLPAGGGKAVVLDHPGLDRERAYRLVGRAVQQLGGVFFTGPDVGTNAADLAVVATETQFVARDQDGGPGDLAGATADGVAAAIRAVAARLELAPSGLTVAVQGLGAVGAKLCAELATWPVRLLVSDVVPERAAAVAAAHGATIVAPEAITATPCDVFAPCALGGVLTAAVAARLPARAVCGAANNIFAGGEAAFVLHRRGIPVVPDFVANAGALILGATWHLTGRRAPRDRVLRIGDTAGELLDRARAMDAPPITIAAAMARQIVERGDLPR
jgi:leucine dehydrogenase